MGDDRQGNRGGEAAGIVTLALVGHVATVNIQVKQSNLSLGSSLNDYG